MANSFEVIGKLHAVMETTQVTDAFRKREFVLEIADGQYPQHVKFQVTQDRCQLLDKFRIGQDLKVLFNLRGRPYSKRDGGTDYWLNLDCWRLEEATATASTGGSTDYAQISPASASPASAADFRRRSILMITRRAMSFIMLGLVILATIAGITHAQQTIPSIKPMKPMDVVFSFEGQWRRNTDRAPIFETWVRESGKSMVGNAYMMTRGIEGDLKERLRIVERDSNIYYQAQVLDQNMGATIEFKLVSYTDTSLTFENRNHDFPKSITYMKIDKDAFDAVLTGTVDGRDYENVYHFARTVQ